MDNCCLGLQLSFLIQIRLESAMIVLCHSLLKSLAFTLTHAHFFFLFSLFVFVFFPLCCCYYQLGAFTLFSQNFNWFDWIESIRGYIARFQWPVLVMSFKCFTYSSRLIRNCRFVYTLHTLTLSFASVIMRDRVLFASILYSSFW